MNELKQCEFLLVRYMPDALTEEFVNVGVVLVEANGSGGFADIRFVRDFRRARCLDPELDVDLLGGLESDLRRQLAQADRDRFLAKLQDYCSNGLQFSSPKACLTSNPAEELESLARIYLQHRRAGRREAAGRQAIAGHMRKAFESAGVWEMMSKKIAASDYTHRGDPLKIDCGYRPNGVMHMFQAVSLQSDVDTAKVLAFSFPELREGMERKQNVKADLTAITEPGLDDSDEAVAFAREVMKSSDIRIATTADLPQFAEHARQELRL